MIEISNLNISYNKPIISEFSYVFQNGIYVISGKNGSGKSTLFKAIINLINYSGDIKVDGNIFYLPEKLILPKTLRIKEFLQTIKKLCNGKNMVEYYMNRYELNDLTFDKCSKGMLQKVGIIASLLSNYNILIYDEPFEGLDINTQKRFIKDLDNLKKHTTILMSLHEDINIGCKKLLLKDGRICEI